MTTTDLSKFGARELAMVGSLLEAQRTQGLPDDFYGDGVQVMMNTMSGYVFLTNSDYQVAMLTDDGELEIFYNSPYEGLEGFFDDLVEEYKDMHPEDKEWFEQIAEYRGELLPLQLDNGEWVEEGDEYWIVDESEEEVIWTVFDGNSDRDATFAFTDEDLAKEALELLK